MTVIVIRDLPARFAGFLASCMLEVAPGVYTAPKMTRSVRERVWTVLVEWYYEAGRGSIVMTWRAPKSPAGQAVRILGSPARELVDAHGFVLASRPLRTED